MGSLENSVVVITGASSGIGRAAALRFAREGAVVVVAARRQAPLQEVADECERLAGRALAVPTDVTDEQAVLRLAQTAMEAFGRIDVWVNNAAVTLFSRLEEAPMEAYRRVIETNLFGYIHGARAVLPWFREQGGGILINNATAFARMGAQFVSAYVISKFGIRGLSECLRQEVIDSPIEICTVLPASIDTPLFQHAGNFTGRAVKPLRPIYSADKVARTIVALARRPRPEVFVGNAGRQMMMTRALSARLFDRMTATQVDKDHFQPRSAEHGPGNLFQPMEAWTSVSGGWKRSKKRLGGGLLLTGLGLLAGLFGLRQRPRRRRFLERARARPAWQRRLPVLAGVLRQREARV